MPHLIEIGDDETVLFGPFRLAMSERRLERNGETVHLGGRAMDILHALISRAGQVVTKAELSAAAWPGMYVEEGSLRFHIASLRKALGEEGHCGRYLTTVAGRGYCFTGAISRTPDGRNEHADPAAEAPRLPFRPQRLIGVDELCARAADELLRSHFLTIVGPPGVGKTSLAARLGHELVSSFPDGVAFVDLGSIGDPQLVLEALAASVDELLPDDEPFKALVARLRGRRMLAIFDGCEHLVDAVAQLAERLSLHLPTLAILVTSRESLRAAGEHVLRMAPLACPPAGSGVTPRDAMSYPAVQLFIDRLAANGLALSLSDADASIVSEICRKLDGIPLALEVAAGRVPAYGLQRTAALLGEHQSLLWRGLRTATPRHQTLSAALDWSYELLSAAERTALRRLSLLVGSFSLDAAVAVATSADMNADMLLQRLADLVSKSLVDAEQGPEGVRYRLLDPIRVYAQTKLMESDEASRVVHRHTAFLLPGLSAMHQHSRSLPGEGLALIYRRPPGAIRGAS